MVAFHMINIYLLSYHIAHGILNIFKPLFNRTSNTDTSMKQNFKIQFLRIKTHFNVSYFYTWIKIHLPIASINYLKTKIYFGNITLFCPETKSIFQEQIAFYRLVSKPGGQSQFFLAMLRALYDYLAVMYLLFYFNI